MNDPWCERIHIRYISSFSLSDSSFNLFLLLFLSVFRLLHISDEDISVVFISVRVQSSLMNTFSLIFSLVCVSISSTCWTEHVLKMLAPFNVALTWALDFRWHYT